MWSTGRKDHFASFTNQNKQSLPLLSLFTLLVHSLTPQYHTATYTTTIKYDLIMTTNTASTTGTITLFYTVHVLLVQLTKKKCLLCNSLFLWFSYKVAEATIMYQVNHVLSQPRLWGTL